MGNRAPILGIAGLIFLAFGLTEHWLTLHPQAGFWSFGWFSIAHLVAGLGCIVWFFAAGTGSLREFVQRRSTRYGTNALVYSVVFVALVTMLNVLAVAYNVRLDVSSTGVNSLTDSSRKVLDLLQEEVELLAFVGPEDKPFIAEVSQIYSHYSDKLKWRIVDPQVSPELAQREMIQNIPTIKIRQGDRSTTVGSIDEEAITNGIHKVATTEQKKVYFLTGHGEPSIDDRQGPVGMGLFADTLRNQNYEIAGIFAAEFEAVPDDAALVVLAAGDRDHFPGEIEMVREFLRKGGSALILLEPQRAPTLAEFARELGATVGDDLILDQQVRLFQGVTIGTDAVVSQYGDHPSVAQMTDRTIFAVARSVTPTIVPPGAPVPFVPVAMTGPTSWAETDVERVFSAGEAELGDDDVRGPVSVGIAGTGPTTAIGSETPGEFKVAVFGDTSFLTNQYLRQLYNDALGQGIVGWLAGEEERIAIAPRVVRASRAHLGEEQARTVFYLSVLVLPELILLAGIIVWWRRSSL